MSRICGDSTLARMTKALIVAGVFGLMACGTAATGDADASVADTGTQWIQDAGNDSDAGNQGKDAGNQPPEGHTLVLGGVAHRPGNTDPLTNCVACHGSDLKGDVGPSCYSCHDNSDHTSVRGGASHKSGSSSTCATCHGPQNTGGLGPACSTCH